MNPRPRFALFSLIAVGAVFAPAMLRAEPAAVVPPVGNPGVPAAPVYIGVELYPVDASTRALFKVPESAGLFVIGVAPGSSADGKLGQGDILLRLDDQVLVNREQLRSLVRAKKVGDAAVFTVLRGGREVAVSLNFVGAPVPVAGAVPELEGAEVLLRRLNEQAVRMMQEQEARTSALAGRSAAFAAARRATLADRVTTSGGLSVVSTRTRVTDDGSVTVVESDGRRTVVVKDPAGKVLVEGELNDALRGKLPEWAAGLIDAKAPAEAAPVAKGGDAPEPAEVPARS